jgi:LysM repeat protein
MKMNTPNPLVPQGTFPDSAAKSRTRIVVFAILAAHVVFVCVLLLQGCKRTTTEPTPPEQTSLAPEPFTNNLVTPPTNLAPPLPETNIVVPPLTNEPPPLPPPAGPEKEHTIVKGDNFYTLGKKYGVGYKAIAEANPGVNPNKLKIGDKIKIPAPKAKEGAPSNGGGATAAPSAEKTYTVKSGDTLMKIAKTHGVTIKALRSANNLRTDRIKVGDKLKIPAKASAPAPAPGASSVEPPTAVPLVPPAGTNI